MSSTHCNCNNLARIRNRGVTAILQLLLEPVIRAPDGGSHRCTFFSIRVRGSHENSHWFDCRDGASQSASCDWPHLDRAERIFMTFQRFAAAYRALTARKDGPSLYDVCDPLFLNHRGGNQHLGRFYRTALGNPALRPLLCRAGLAELPDEACLQRLRRALIRARDDSSPDCAAIGEPVAALLDTIDLQHPKPGPAPVTRRAPGLAQIGPVIRICGAHLLRSFASCGFIPAYAAFNLIGDAHIRGPELLAALTGLNSRGYKNATLLFNLARIFIARSPARALINPPWTGIAEPMWEPMQIP